MTIQSNGAGIEVEAPIEVYGKNYFCCGWDGNADIKQKDIPNYIKRR